MHLYQRAAAVVRQQANLTRHETPVRCAAADLHLVVAVRQIAWLVVVVVVGAPRRRLDRGDHVAAASIISGARHRLALARLVVPGDVAVARCSIRLDDDARSRRLAALLVVVDRAATLDPLHDALHLRRQCVLRQHTVAGVVRGGRLVVAVLNVTIEEIVAAVGRSSRCRLVVLALGNRQTVSQRHDEPPRTVEQPPQSFRQVRTMPESAHREQLLRVVLVTRAPRSGRTRHLVATPRRPSSVRASPRRAVAARAITLRRLQAVVDATVGTRVTSSPTVGR